MRADKLIEPFTFCSLNSINSLQFSHSMYICYVLRGMSHVMLLLPWPVYLVQVALLLFHISQCVSILLFKNKYWA